MIQNPRPPEWQRRSKQHENQNYRARRKHPALTDNRAEQPSAEKPDPERKHNANESRAHLARYESESLLRYPFRPDRFHEGRIRTQRKIFSKHEVRRKPPEKPPVDKHRQQYSGRDDHGLTKKRRKRSVLDIIPNHHEA